MICFNEDEMLKYLKDLGRLVSHHKISLPKNRTLLFTVDSGEEELSIVILSTDVGGGIYPLINKAQATPHLLTDLELSTLRENSLESVFYRIIKSKILKL